MPRPPIVGVCLPRIDPEASYPHSHFLTRPQANAIGRSAKTVREFLEEKYNADVAASDTETIKLAVKALLEVVQSGSKSMEIAVMKRGQPLRVSALKLFFIGRRPRWF